MSSGSSDVRSPWLRATLLRLFTAASAGVVVVAGIATEAAHDRGRVDEAGVVLVGVCSLGLLFVAFHAWRNASLSMATAKLDAAQAAEPRRQPRSGVAVRESSVDDAIVVDAVTVRYGLRTALDDFSLRVRRGEIVGLLGPNGAGKTTTVDVCCGLRKPVSGRASILGHDAIASSAAVRRSIGVVPQETGLYPELTAAEYLKLFAAMYNLKDSPTRIEELLRLMGLWERRNTRIQGFSGGMKRRLALSRALLHNPPVLFLDEPTLGVDVHGRRALWDHVSRLRDEGRSVLLTTNYLEEATALCDRVVIIDEGVVLADERPDELRRQSGTTLVLETTGDAAALATAVRSACAVDPTVGEGQISVPLPREELAAAVVQAASSAGPVTAMRTEQPSLEEVFLRLTGRELRE